MKRTYETEFHAAHVIVGHERCGRVHGHTYKLRVHVNFPQDVWLDFSDLKKVVDETLEYEYDHRFLGTTHEEYNSVPGHGGLVEIKIITRTVTCEELAKKLRYRIDHELATVLKCDYTVEIELWETSKFGVRE